MEWIAAILLFGASFAALSLGVLLGRPLHHTCASGDCAACDHDGT